MALGRGLASLIPNRRIKDPDEGVDEIEEIDSMEIVAEDTPAAVEEETVPESAPSPVGIPVVEEEDDGFDVAMNEASEAVAEAEALVDEEAPVAVEDQVEAVEASSIEIQEEEPEVAEASALEVDETPDVVEASSIETEEQPEVAEASSAEIVDNFDDFGQLDGGEELPPPSKPMVTPLELDPQADADLIDLAHTTARSKEEVHQPKARIAQKIEQVVAAEDVKEEKPVVEESVSQRAESKVAETDDTKWDKHEEQVIHISIGDISINPLQPRRHFDAAELAELKDSIDQHGILQPLVVARLEDGKYQLIAGERRLRASKELKWNKVPCVVRRDVESNQTRLVFALIENIQRENLNPIELALAYQQLHDEYGLSHDEIGHRMGKARVSVTNAMRVLQLPAEVQRGLIEGKISPGHARAILMIPDEEKQVRFYHHLLDEGLTVRKAETRARRIQRTMGVHDPMRQKRRTRHPMAQKYSPLLEERYATDANVRFDDEKNRFEVILKAYSVKEFEQLVGRLLGSVDLPDLSKDDDVLEG